MVSVKKKVYTSKAGSISYTNSFFIANLHIMLIRNKIPQSDVNIFSHLTFLKILTCYAILTKNDAFNRLNVIKLVISRSILVEIDISLALFKKNFFCGHFDFFF